MEAPLSVLRELFDYDPKRGVLVFKVQRRHIPPGGSPTTFTRNSAGRPCAMTVKIASRGHSVHRIIWRLCRGEIPPGMVVDHIDGNIFNNRLDNLRVVTTAINARNMRRKKNNSSGLMGVYWDKARTKWAAECMVNRKKHFIGRFETYEDACQARLEYQERFGFHENHGREVVQLEAA